MNYARLFILVSQLGRVFARSYKVRKYCSGLVAIGFYLLFIEREKRNKKYYGEETPTRIFRTIEEDEII